MEAAAVDRFLAEARRGLDRVQPADLDHELRDGALLIDIRPEANRTTEGELPNAVVIERIHLEWRLDPTSSHRIPEITPAECERRVIIVCNEGYASSLAAATLQQLGLGRATDLAGGYRAWIAHQTDTTAPEPS
jgi:rhodanese-related sulfurtransferase